MEFIKLAQERFSCKKFSGKEIAKETLDLILKAGQVAPTAKNLQPQRIYVMQSEEALKLIDANTPCRYGAPVVLVVAFDKENVFTFPGGKATSGMEDTSIVATHMMLEAADLGVNSCWLNFFDPEKLASDMALPENEQIVMLLDLGYAADGAGPLATHTSIKDICETVEYR